MNKHKIGIVGFGGMANYHFDMLNGYERAEVVGIFDIDSSKFELAKKKNLKIYNTQDEILSDSEIDIILVATSNEVHKEISINALRAGKNVICEKPVTMCSKDLEDIIQVANKCGKLFTVHQNRRWDEDFLTIKKIFDDNTLCNVYRIESRVQGSRGIPGDWRNQLKHGGGMVYDWGIHLLDQALMMTYPRRISSVYTELTNVTNENCDDGFRTTIIFNDGLSFYVEVGTSNFITLPRWYMLGENGSAVINDWSCNGKIVMVSDWENKDAVPIVAGAGITKTMAPRDEDSIKEYRLPVQEADWGEYYENVFAYLRGEQAIIVTHEQQRRLIRLVEAIFASGYSGKVVEFENGL